MPLFVPELGKTNGLSLGKSVPISSYQFPEYADECDGGSVVYLCIYLARKVSSVLVCLFTQVQFFSMSDVGSTVSRDLKLN